MEIDLKNKYSTISMVCGILSVIFSVIPIIGLTLGIIAIANSARVKSEFEERTNKSLAGLICGIVGIIIAVGIFIYAINLLVSGNIGLITKILN